ncbi:MAG: hypothetical protein LWX83_02455 [Anaerolineae bacterium]|nr:hypothetical protein [Anaerolineae bacterium]
METADILRLILLLGCAGMAVMAFVYLRRRRLQWWQFILWETLAIILPVLGPFLVIVFKPGESYGSIQETRRQRRPARY